MLYHIISYEQDSELGCSAGGACATLLSWLSLGCEGHAPHTENANMPTRARLRTDMHA